MKVTIPTPIKTDTLVREMPVQGAFAGIGIKSIELDYLDFRTLSQLTPEQLHSWFQRLYCRFY